MIVLGEKYKFTELEVERLSRTITNLDIIKYKKLDDEEIIEKIDQYISNDGLIVLNTKAKVSNAVIKHLTRLELTGIKYLSIEHFLEKYLHKCYIPESHTDLHYLEDINAYSTWQYFQKRAIDYFGIFWLLFFSWPVMLISRNKIQQQSPGPTIYQQLRVGYNNKEFTCKKFRSMRLDAEKNGVKFASKNDSRIFPFGEIMRKTRIDELPQMLNILKGEMHLIGPRPERKYWIDKFENEIPYYNQRHLIRPGITGWAQVMYPYGENVEDAKQKLMYDLYYIKYWSLKLELKIVWKTAMTVLGKKGV